MRYNIFQGVHLQRQICHILSPSVVFAQEILRELGQEREQADREAQSCTSTI